MIDIRTEIREAFEKEQSAFPPPAALRVQVVAAVNSHAGPAGPARQRADRDWNWLLVAAAALLAIAIVAGLLAVRLTNLLPPPINTGPAPQRCVPGATPSSDRFARVHGCITYSDGFDGFPMFSPDGKKLVWASNRNAKAPHETNIFIGEWVP